MRKLNISLKILGVVLLLFWLGDTYIKLFVLHAPQEMLSFFSVGIVISGVGLLLENVLLTTVSTCLLLVPESFWIAGTLYLLFTQKSLLGINSLFLSPAYPKSALFLQMVNFLVLPVLFYGIVVMRKMASKGWIVTGVLFLLLNIGAFFYPDRLGNVNCLRIDSVGMCHVLFSPFYSSHGLAMPLVNVVLISVLSTVIVFLPINKLGEYLLKGITYKAKTNKEQNSRRTWKIVSVFVGLFIVLPFIALLVVSYLYAPKARIAQIEQNKAQTNRMKISLVSLANILHPIMSKATTAQTPSQGTPGPVTQSYCLNDTVNIDGVPQTINLVATCNSNTPDTISYGTSDQQFHQILCYQSSQFGRCINARYNGNYCIACQFDNSSTSAPAPIQGQAHVAKCDQNDPTHSHYFDLDDNYQQCTGQTPVCLDGTDPGENAVCIAKDDPQSPLIAGKFCDNSQPQNIITEFTDGTNEEKPCPDGDSCQTQGSGSLANAECKPAAPTYYCQQNNRYGFVEMEGDKPVWNNDSFCPVGYHCQISNNSTAPLESDNCVNDSTGQTYGQDNPQDNSSATNFIGNIPNPGSGGISNSVMNRVDSTNPSSPYSSNSQSCKGQDQNTCFNIYSATANQNGYDQYGKCVWDSNTCENTYSQPQGSPCQYSWACNKGLACVNGTCQSSQGGTGQVNGQMQTQLSSMVCSGLNQNQCFDAYNATANQSGYDQYGKCVWDSGSCKDTYTGGSGSPCQYSWACSKGLACVNGTCQSSQGGTGQVNNTEQISTSSSCSGLSQNDCFAVYNETSSNPNDPNYNYGLGKCTWDNGACYDVYSNAEGGSCQYDAICPQGQSCQSGQCQDVSTSTSAFSSASWNYYTAQ